MLPARILFLSLLFTVTAFAREEPAGIPAEGTEFRTEEDDLAELEEMDTGSSLGRIGAVRFPIDIEQACIGSLALYTPQGQMVRILAQAVPLSPGRHMIAWDGLDLFGNLVPADTELVIRLISNEGIKAYYEFTVGHGNRQPWGGVVAGEGLEQIQGGWLGDHSTPNAITAFRDYVVAGCFLAEDGDNIQMMDLRGRKIWGRKLSGWTGPLTLDADDRYVYALLRGRKRIARFDPLITDMRQARSSTKWYESGKDDIHSMTGYGEWIYYSGRNHETDINLYGRPRLNIDFAAAIPQVLSGEAATEFHISPRAAFAGTFGGGGHPQRGAGFAFKNRTGFIVVPFGQEVRLGGFLLSQVPDVESIEVYALKQGLTYSERDHSPMREAGTSSEIGLDGFSGGALLDLGGLDLSDMDPNWERVGSTPADQALNVVSLDKGYIHTAAIYLKAILPPAADRREAPRVSIRSAQVFGEPFRRVEAQANVLPVSDGIEQVISTGAPSRPGWNLRTEYQVSGARPVMVVLDYGREVTFDGIGLLNPMNDDIRIDRYTGPSGANPATAGEAHWEEIRRFSGGGNRKIGSYTAAKAANLQVLNLPEAITVRALRFRTLSGYKTGKYAQLLGGPGGEGSDNPRRVEVDQVALFRLNNPHERPPRHVFAVLNAENGETEHFHKGDELEFQALTAAPDGTLYGASENRIFRLNVTAAGVTRTPVNSVTFDQIRTLAVSRDRIAVGDAEKKAVFLFDHAGRPVGTVGNVHHGMRPRGPWNPKHISTPGGVALDAEGNVWVAETEFAPKRISRFSPTGDFLAEYLGPPMYGGGGSLDPSLRRFYYRSMEFALDFETGRSRLIAKNDACYSPESPALENSTFTFTSINRPVFHDNRRYLIGGGGGLVITLKPSNSPVWTPAVVMGPAHDSMLLKKEVWRDHFGGMDLVNKSFIWCDLNDNGEYEIDEVQIFDPSDWAGTGAIPTRGSMGPGMTIWAANGRLEPRDFTAGGVPIYRVEDWQPFDYSELAPHYSKNYTLGGPTSAKPAYGGFRTVLSDGSLIQEGQPYIVQADGTIYGGPVTTAPSDYVPDISGDVLNQPWKFAGTAVTRSPVGEVAAINSNNGYWYLWGAKYGMIIGTFFDGSAGGWDSSLPAIRGTDVTGRKHGWEGWGSHFTKGVDGNYYAVAGKGFHGLHRIDGLDDFQVQGWRLTVPADAVDNNRRLRPLLKARQQARAKANGRTSRVMMQPQRLQDRTTRFSLDGDIEDWGPRENWQTIGPDARRLFVDVAYDDKGIYLAFAGEGKLQNAAKDWRKLFHHGFSFSFLWREQGRNRSRDLIPGDRKFVFGKHDGQWRAVHYDYARRGSGEPLAVETDLASVEVADVRMLSQQECIVKVQEDTLGIDIRTLGTLDDDFGSMPSLDGMPSFEEPRPASPAGGGQHWTAEVFIPYSTLGDEINERNWQGRRRIDFAVHHANKAGDAVETSDYWSNTANDNLGDEALQLLVDPATWGFFGTRR